MTYQVTQFTDDNLSHYGYLLISNGEAVAVDPPRDAQPLFDALEEADAGLTAIMETHPHADFVSSHLELHQRTGAPVYCSKLLGADYDHVPFDDGDTLTVGNVTLEALNTPGHSPDSISILVRDADGKESALFSGDTLFVGDVGRPDLREKAGNMQAKREELAGMMYDTVQNVLKQLPDDVVVYPAHGVGTLCGKALGTAPSTTIGAEKASNPAFRETDRDAFIERLTDGQPFIPQYFAYDVDVNRNGAPSLEDSLEDIPVLSDLPDNALVVDTRDADAYRDGHMHRALHLGADGRSFETWLGTLVHPHEPFVIVTADDETRHTILHRVAKIGYEQTLRGVYVGDIGEERSQTIDAATVQRSPEEYTIVDVRQPNEVQEQTAFADSLHIPLNELPDRIQEVPQDKPIAVHCAGGYRSRIAQSILEPRVSVPVYDIGEDIKDVL